MLASLLARDNYLPHLFALRDDRQVFGNGIWFLAILSGALLIAVNGNTLTLIPLFAVGVFTGFTLAQAGLVVHWRRERPQRWRQRAVINATGAVTTAVATVVLLVTKFTEGAWVIALAVPAFIVLFTRIHAYYERVGQALGVGAVPPKPRRRHSVVVVPVTGVSILTEHAIAEALSIGEKVIAVTVVSDATAGGAEGAREVRRQWEQWRPGVPWRVLHTEYASVVRPIVAFIDELREHHREQIVVLIPTVLPERLRYTLLHNHLDLVLSNALRSRSDVVVARVPMPLRAQNMRSPRAGQGE